MTGVTVTAMRGAGAVALLSWHPAESDAAATRRLPRLRRRRGIFIGVILAHWGPEGQAFWAPAQAFAARRLAFAGRDALRMGPRFRQRSMGGKRMNGRRRLSLGCAGLLSL